MGMCGCHAVTCTKDSTQTKSPLAIRYREGKTKQRLRGIMGGWDRVRVYVMCNFIVGMVSSSKPGRLGIRYRWITPEQVGILSQP